MSELVRSESEQRWQDQDGSQDDSWTKEIAGVVAVDGEQKHDVES